MTEFEHWQLYGGKVYGAFPQPPPAWWEVALAALWRPASAIILALVVLAVCASGPLQPQNKARLAPLDRPTVTATEPRPSSASWPILAGQLTAVSDQPTDPPAAPPEAPGDASTLTAVASPAVRVWQPADECSRITRPVSRQMMRWCPITAYYLHLADTKLPGEQWTPGTLTRLVVTWDCESGGNPAARNPSSGAFGIVQHLPKYWDARAAYTARFFEFTNPDITMPYDQIAVGVALYLGVGERGGIRHWTCWPKVGRP